jgi:uncharacterized protein
MTGLREITADELEDLATGAGVLGTGGGTHPYLELLNIQKLYRAGKRVAMIDPADLDDDAAVAVTGFMGAPLVTKERLPDPDHAVRPVRLMEAYTKRPFDAVMSIEIGSENSILPLLIGALTGMPIVDADAMGRAFPEAQMASFAIRGLPMSPFAMCDIRDNDLILTRTASPTWTERLGRQACIEVGSIAATCSAPRSGREIKDHAILGSVSRALRLGAAVRAARRRHSSPIDAVLEIEDGVALFRGKIADVARRTTDGFIRGQARIDGLDTYAGSRFDVDFQNEFSIGRHDGEVVVTVPDLICILDSVTGEALGTESIRYGQRVDVLSLAADPLQRSPEGLQWVGPRAFGFDLDYVSLHG